jgi:hypothetical protein
MEDGHVDTVLYSKSNGVGFGGKKSGRRRVDMQASATPWKM